MQILPKLSYKHSMFYNTSDNKSDGVVSHIVTIIFVGNKLPRSLSSEGKKLFIEGRQMF